MAENSPFLIAFVGMPGSGKSEASNYIKQKGASVIRLGDLTEQVIKEKNQPLTPETEEKTREDLRREFGMAVYAEKAVPKIADLLKGSSVIIDGLYSWEEYLLLKEKFPTLTLVHIYAQPAIRYERLSSRKVRPFTPVEARKRDIAEIEHLSKGGPIAIADFLAVNNDSMAQLYAQLDTIYERLTTI